jgi:cytochrome P450
MLAGHETTSTGVTWTLYELARFPDVQNRVRVEIMEMKAKAQERGDDDLTMHDFDSMPYTTAVIKETLRFNPTVTRIFREAAMDDILPLYTPITTTSGKVVKEIAIQKGTRMYISIHGYHL